MTNYVDHNDYESVEAFDKAIEEVVDFCDQYEYDDHIEYDEDEEARLQRRGRELDKQFEAEGGK